jgi:hypothetical protein
MYKNLIAPTHIIFEPLLTLFLDHFNKKKINPKQNNQNYLTTQITIYIYIYIYSVKIIPTNQPKSQQQQQITDQKLTHKSACHFLMQAATAVEKKEKKKKKNYTSARTKHSCILCELCKIAAVEHSCKLTAIFPSFFFFSFFFTDLKLAAAVDCRESDCLLTL